MCIQTDMQTTNRHRQARRPQTGRQQTGTGRRADHKQAQTGAQAEEHMVSMLIYTLEPFHATVNLGYFT